jgi:hypothetical protein
MSLKLSIQSLVPGCAALLCLTGIIGLQKQYYSENLNSNRNSDYFQQEKSLETTLGLQKQTPYFGFNNLVADWHFLQYIQYFGDEKARNKTGYHLVTDYFEAIIDANPRFIKAILSLSASNSIFAGRPDKTVVLMDRALKSISPKYFPFAYLIWTYKATDQILFLGDIKAAKKSYETGAEWAEARGDKFGEEAAIRPRETARFLATNPNPTKARIYAWMEIFSNAKDQKTRMYALGQVQSLGAKILVGDRGELKIILPQGI